MFKKLLFLTIVAAAVGYFMFYKSSKDAFDYKLIENSSERIHILKINPEIYKAELVKANNGEGREFLSSIASRTNAKIAINAGFFEIGEGIDGKASKTLVINGKIYNIIDEEQSLLKIRNNKINIESGNPSLLNLENISLVTGIPMLVTNEKVIDSLYNKNSDYFTGKHARTAIGLTKEDNIIILVAEHSYQRDLAQIPIGEINSILINDKEKYLSKFGKNKIEDLTLLDIKKILHEKYKKEGDIEGLTILELAEIMLKEGCVKAINLDGGGSSALWVKDKIINNITGDKDENPGSKGERAISDAIIFY